MRWLNLNIAIIILVIIIILYFIGMGIVGFSLWNETKARELFPFIAISEVFPIKAIALFTGLATLGTLFLSLATILTIRSNNEREGRNRKEQYLNEIIGWTIKLEGRIFSPPDISIVEEIKEDLNAKSKYKSEKLLQTLSEIRETERIIASLERLQMESKDGEYIRKLAFKLDNNLGSCIKELLEAMKIRQNLFTNTMPYHRNTGDIIKEAEIKIMIECLEDENKPFDGLDLSERCINAIALGRNAGTIRTLISNVVDKAVEIKGSLLKP